jgi:hypothetical protein
VEIRDVCTVKEDPRVGQTGGDNDLDETTWTRFEHGFPGNFEGTEVSGGQHGVSVQRRSEAVKLTGQFEAFLLELLFASLSV